MKKYRLGIIGCGNMAQAIIKGATSETMRYFLKKNGMRIELGVSDPDESKLKAVEGAATAYEGNAALIEASDYVLLAVKPQAAAEALGGLDFSGKVVISIMAGVNLSRLSELTGGGTDKLVRVMPNLNARLGNSYNAYAAKNLSEEESEFVKSLLNTFGEAYNVPEEKMNSVTGIAGSGPAFVMLFIKAFIDEAISEGFDPVSARRMALSTVIGSAYLVEDAADTPIDTLVSSVCSKGGTTIEGVTHLAESGFEDIVRGAIKKAVRRSEEMERSL